MSPFALNTRPVPGLCWSERFAVRAYETDQEGRLSVLSLCHFLQEAAANHARELGVGLDVLNGRNLTWMLSRLRLAVKRLPAAGAHLTVHTWPSGRDRLFALRDFVVQTDDGDRFAAADSAWLVIDQKRRRPVRIEPFLEPLSSAAGEPVLEKPIPRLPTPGAGHEARRFCVRYRDLDGNRHVNNVTYVEWVLEGFDPGFVGNRTLERLEVEYLAEALAGETVRCTNAPLEETPGHYVHGIFREGDGRELARARTKWS
ncbi:MAG: thioesterase [Desulfobacterales bacterium]|jgi:acyl-ACP thioesterase